MKRLRLLTTATFITLVSLSGCRTAQQAPIVIQQPEIITQKEEEVVAISEDEIPANQGITFFEGNLQDAFEKAKTENKLVFVDCYTTWCGPCKILKRYTFNAVFFGQYFALNGFHING